MDTNAEEEHVADLSQRKQELMFELSSYQTNMAEVAKSGVENTGAVGAAPTCAGVALHDFECERERLGKESIFTVREESGNSRRVSCRQGSCLDWRIRHLPRSVATLPASVVSVNWWRLVRDVGCRLTGALRLFRV